MVHLRQERERRGMSQLQLSVLSHIPQQTISAIESGARKNPGVETLRPIAKALGCSVDDLLSDDCRKEGESA